MKLTSLKRLTIFIKLLYSHTLSIPLVELDFCHLFTHSFCFLIRTRGLPLMLLWKLTFRSFYETQICMFTTDSRQCLLWTKVFGFIKVNCSHSSLKLYEICHSKMEKFYRHFIWNVQLWDGFNWFVQNSLILGAFFPYTEFKLVSCKFVLLLI